MLHEQLWAPWRLAYIAPGEKPAAAPEHTHGFLPGADADCFLCRAVAAKAADGTPPDRENLVVLRGESCIVVLNKFPYNNGHLLIAPLTHKGRLDELTSAESTELQQLMATFVGKLEALMNAQGFNIGLNLGHAAGAGLPGHLHWHIVPRWSGDTNFMGVLAGVEVIPQSLDALWQLLQSQ